MANELVNVGGVWTLKEAAAAGGSTGMPGMAAAALKGTIAGPAIGSGAVSTLAPSVDAAAAALKGTIAGPAIGSGAVSTLAPGIDVTGAGVVAVLNLPSANLDTSDKVLGTASLKLNEPSNSNDQLLTPYNALFDFAKGDPFSVSCWIKGRAWSSIADYVARRFVDGSPYTGWDVRMQSSGKPYFRLISDWSATDYIAVEATSALTINTWYHVVWTYDGSSNRTGLLIYVDGQVVATTGTGSSSLTGEVTSNAVLAVGGYYPSTSYAWQGWLDDFAIWNVKLDPLTDIPALYNSGAGALANTVLPGNLVAYYPFDTSTTSKDMSGNNLHLEFLT